MNNWPSTTTVLKDAGLYGDAERWYHHADATQPAEYECKNSAQRGRFVDGGCNLLAMGKTLGDGWKSHEACCMPFLEGYREFLLRHKVKLIQCAYEVVNKAERYVGHPDQTVMLCDGHGSEVRATLDVKSGGFPPVTPLQLASYESAQRSMGMPRSIRVGLQLTRGDFKLHYFNDPRDFDEWTILVRAHWIRAKFQGLGA
jgi:hypothetical protein